MVEKRQWPKGFPTMEQVEKANKETPAHWYSRLIPQNDSPQQQKIVKRAAERFKELGGWTPELREIVGY